MELSIAPYIPKWTRIISHGVFTLVFLVLIIQFDAADLFTISLIIALTIMGLVPQPHGVYMKGLQAKGHFYRWEDINEIAVPRKTAVFQLKLKRKFFYNIMFSVSTNDREVLTEALKKKPVKLEIDK